MTRVLRSLAVISLLAVGLTVGGCDLSELNENPNAATSANPAELLTNAQLDIAATYWQDYPGGFWMRYSQYITTNQYTDGDRFLYPSARGGSNNANFRDFYYVLNDLQEIIRAPGQPGVYGPEANQIAIAKILQAWTFQLLTDMYGPVPYTDALKGDVTGGEFQPSYTSQQEIYTSLIDSLTAASNMIQTGSSALSGGDLMYGGDMSNWKAFANALKMRVAMRMSDQMPQAAATAIDEAVQAGAFESNAENAVVPFGSSQPYTNPMWAQYEIEGRDDWAAPHAIAGVMNKSEDPRRAAYFSDADADSAGNQFNGFPYGLSQGDAQSLFTSPDRDFSRPGPRVRGSASEPAILMLYDEVLFIKAEAALRSDMSVPSITEDPEQLYQDAITASVERWTGSDDGASTLIDNLDMPGDSGFEVDQDLAVQKWIAQYMQGVQGWSTWRRTDFQGVLQIPPGNPGQDAFGRDIAVRMSYPTDEATLNAENLDSAVNNLLGGSGGEDDQGTLLWWDTEYRSPR